MYFVTICAKYVYWQAGSDLSCMAQAVWRASAPDKGLGTPHPFQPPAKYKTANLQHFNRDLLFKM